MEIVGQRLRALRTGMQVSQAKMAQLIDIKQSSLHKYETDQTAAPAEVLLKYADYFNVSMDYIFGRTDNPQGTLYEYTPKVNTDNPELKQFIEMCFDPNSPVSEKMKQTLYAMMVQEDKKQL